MSSIWIVHREAAARAALTRLAAAPEETLLGSPRDSIFELASGAGAVVLGLSGDDLELELEFAHRAAPRLPECHWIVVSDGVDPAPLRRLFTGVPLTVLRWPPHPDELRAAIGAALGRRPDESLPQRRYRTRLQMRFARWFADLDLPQLLRAVDPANAQVPLLLRGEIGTGRELAARYVHCFANDGSAGPFVALACSSSTDERELLAQIEAILDAPPERCTLWFDQLDRLPATTQRAVQGWLEFGVPRGSLVGAQVRFAASVADGQPRSRPALAPGLLAAFGGLGIRIPPLRERADAIEAIATDILRSATPESERARALSPAALQLLGEHPWPENLRELESVLLRTLASSDANPIDTRHLCFEPVSPSASASESARHERRVGDRASASQRHAPGAPPSHPQPSPADLRPGAVDPGQAEAERRPDATRGERPGATNDHWIDLERPPLPEPIYLDDPESAVDHTFDLARALDLPGGEDAEDDAPWDREPLFGDAGAVLPVSEGGTGAEAALRRVLRAITHELRNPLVSARTLAELLPDHHDDRDFRERMTDLVGADVRRMESLLNRLERIVVGETHAAEAVDVSELLASLLEEQREAIQRRRLLVLRELEPERPVAIADPLRLRATLESLIGLAIERVQERGDVYVATHHNPSGLRGRPALRLLIRYSRGSAESETPRVSLGSVSEAAGAMRNASEDENSVALALAETAVCTMGGRFTLDTSRASETVIVADLPAPD